MPNVKKIFFLQLFKKLFFQSKLLSSSTFFCSELVDFFFRLSKMPRMTRARTEQKRQSKNGTDVQPPEAENERDDPEMVVLDQEEEEDGDKVRRARRSEPRRAFQHQLDNRSISWWSSRRADFAGPSPHLCYSSAVIPCMIVATILLILLAAKYEQLAQPAELATNITLDVLRTRGIIR